MPGSAHPDSSAAWRCHPPRPSAPDAPCHPSSPSKSRCAPRRLRDRSRSRRRPPTRRRATLAGRSSLEFGKSPPATARGVPEKRRRTTLRRRTAPGKKREQSSSSHALVHGRKSLAALAPCLTPAIAQASAEDPWFVARLAQIKVALVGVYHRVLV